MSYWDRKLIIENRNGYYWGGDEWLPQYRARKYSMTDLPMKIDGAIIGVHKIPPRSPVFDIQYGKDGETVAKVIDAEEEQ